MVVFGLGENLLFKSILGRYAYVVLVKSTVDILQNFVAFSEYMNLNMKIMCFWSTQYFFSVYLKEASNLEEKTFNIYNWSQVFWQLNE